MNTTNEQLNDLSEIRKLMEKSSRFMSLSGLSEVAAGFIALISAAIVFFYLNFNERYFSIDQYFIKGLYYKLYYSFEWIVVIAAITLFAAIGSAIFFTVIKAKKKGLAI